MGTYKEDINNEQEEEEPKFDKEDSSDEENKNAEVDAVQHSAQPAILPAVHPSNKYLLQNLHVWIWLDRNNGYGQAWPMVLMVMLIGVSLIQGSEPPLPDMTCSKMICTTMYAWIGLLWECCLPLLIQTIM